MRGAAGLGGDGEDGVRLRAWVIPLLEEIDALSRREECSSWPSPAPGPSCILTGLIFLTCYPSSECVRLLNPLPAMDMLGFYCFALNTIISERLFIILKKMLVIPLKQ